MNMILLSTTVMGTLGLITAIVLVYASKKLEVKIDPNIEHIDKILPGLNCGACGYAGCLQYAEAIASGKAKLNLCRPGGQKVIAALNEYTGKTAKAGEELVAQRFCGGGINEAKTKYAHVMIKSCRAAAIVNNGFKECPYSCLWLGDCSRACPVSAITMGEDGLPNVDKNKCTGCEKCVKECPRNVLRLVPKKSIVHVRCSTNDPPRVVVKVCSVGCIGCKACEKACPFDAIHVPAIGNPAIIDYAKCKNCQKCVKVCPRKIIDVDVRQTKTNIISAKADKDSKEAVKGHCC